MAAFGWMRGTVRKALAIGGMSVLPLITGVAPATAQDQPVIPPKRVMLIANTDLPGGDLATILDIPLQSCIRACLDNDQCEALTFNDRSRACFPKGADAGARSPFTGAFSGLVVPASPDLLERAEARRKAAPFLTESDMSAAYDQARSIGGNNPPVDLPDDPQALASSYEISGDYNRAAAMLAMQVARDDLGSDWMNLARLRVSHGSAGSEESRSLAINAYLRSSEDALAGRALSLLSSSYEAADRNSDSLATIRLAAQLAPNDSAIADALEKSEARNGMRVVDSQVEADGRMPRFCASMSRELSTSVDYAQFLRLPAGDLTVEASGQRLCIEGLSHGADLQITLRKGLPSADGEVLAKDVDLKAYIRDRKPEVRFPGRGYVLPSTGDQRISMQTVNADEVALRLLKISDRNLIRAMSEDMFASPLDRWQVDYFSDQMARELWKGTATVAKPMGQNGLNTELTTSLAIPAEAGPLEPGIYILEAGLVGANAEETGLSTQWFVISDFGISTYSGTDGLTVVVRSLRDTSPKTGAEVALVSRSNEVLARAMTDDQGVAHFAPGLSLGKDGAAPALVSVADWQGEGAERAPRDMAFLSLSSPEFDLSDRGVEGLPPAPAMDLFVTTDRGAYRVGETVNATILTRDAEARALDNLPLTAKIIRPDGVELTTMAPQKVANGGSLLNWTIPGNAPRGSWRIELYAQTDAPALATARILVEDFLPERIDFTPALPEGPQRAGAELHVSLAARWLFGAPAANLPVEGSYRISPSRELSGLPGYLFGLQDDETQPVTDMLPGGFTDDQGNFETDITLPDATQLGARPASADIILNVREGAGRPVERTETRIVMPDAPVVGIRPLFEDLTVSEGSDARFNLIAVGPDMRPVDDKLVWQLNRLDVDYQWYSVDGSWDWERIVSRSRIDAGEVQSGQNGIEIDSRVDWGEYELVVKSTSGDSQSSVQFYAGWGASASGGTDTPDRLQVALDKPAYRTGETAEVRVESLFDGLGLVSVLSNRVVTLQTVALKTGDNTISLPVTDEWGAGVYVTVSAIRPIEGVTASDRTPVRGIGLAHAAVDPGDRKLTASLTAPAETRPRGMIPVTLKVEGAAPGEQINATIAAVDQGILNLTRFTPPDPSKHYFGQRRLGVALRDLYGRLILSTGAPDGALRQGGDASAASSPDAPPPTEKLMSWFSGPLVVGADGTVSVEVPVPDFNGEVRVMAVVWSQKAVGQADASVLVRDPVVMTVTAPAFLAPGDTAQVGLRLTHATGPAGEVGLSVAQTGGDSQLQLTLPQDKVTLAENAEARLSMPVTASGGEGLAQLRLTLTTPGGEQLTKDIAIPVALNEPDTQNQDRITIGPQQSMTVPATLTDGLLPGSLVTMAVGPYGRLDVAGALARLERYPYGCTEQLTSRAMPLLYLPRLSAIEGVPNDTTSNDGDLDKRLQDVIAQILTRQAANGGFGLWSADSGDLWLEAYVTDFLSRARSVGFKVPDQAFRMAIDNLRNRVNYATDPSAAYEYDNAALAYAAAVLARERAANIGDLRYYVDTAASAFKTPMAAANLGAALAAAGDQERADRMFREAREKLKLIEPEKQYYRSDYGTNLRDAAAVLALTTESHSQALDGLELASSIGAQLDLRSTNRWGLSTQESIWTILAANALSQDAPGIALNGVPLGQPVASLPDAASAQLSNPTDKPVEITLTATGKSIGPRAEGGKGYNITTRAYDMEGQAIDPKQLSLGTRFVVEVRVEPWKESSGGRLLVAVPLAAGWEIDNPNLLQGGDVAALDWLKDQPSTDMAEFRSDRFAASLTWTSDQPFSLAFIARAVTPGQFRLPSASVEDMYRPEYRSWNASATATVAP
ncbi:alpha-2-macroglobulin family protein [Paracoccus sulfuroxidans]|uniref:Apple domain-containing protein n=1 Tax=Paracoccus sulfuroxidans TaxID=384678 RepID=A0A562NQ42_9RHOB|nr:alpha-2-macroglobulin family protein [Paracoccus sulfuroxidans]TWI33836.1 hypothetical protein IQ24_02200 [Paracoccus sulfuroxidans]